MVALCSFVFIVNLIDTGGSFSCFIISCSASLCHLFHVCQVFMCFHSALNLLSTFLSSRYIYDCNIPKNELVKLEPNMCVFEFEVKFEVV